MPALSSDDGDLAYAGALALFLHIALIASLQWSRILPQRTATTIGAARSLAIEIDFAHARSSSSPANPATAASVRTVRTQLAPHRREPPSTALPAEARPSRLTQSVPPRVEPDSAGSRATVPPRERADGALCMRDCKPTPERSDATPAATSDPATAIAASLQARSPTAAVDGRVVIYSDGGRLLSGDNGAQPSEHAWRLALSELANGKVGSKSAREVCTGNVDARTKERTLVVLLDTSASMRGLGTACAAAAALSALEKGVAVEILNFSTRLIHQPPTHLAKDIYDAVTTVQNGHTNLLAADWLVSPRALPRDFVIVSDSRISNLEDTIPSYGRAISSNPENRAIFYLVGRGSTQCLDQCINPHSDGDAGFCENCGTGRELDQVRAIESAGFQVVRITDQ